MKISTTFTITAISAFLLIGCGGVKPMLSNMHKGTYESATAPAGILDVSVSMLPLAPKTEEPEKPKTFLDLRDSLPHTYIKILGSKTNDPEKLIELLKKPLWEPPRKPAEKKQTDYTEYKARLAFSNTKKYYNFAAFQHPNTRLDALNITVTIPDAPGGGGIAPCSFYTIDRLENEFEEVDFGAIERTQAVTISSKISAAGELGSSLNNTNTATSGANNTNSRESNMAIFDSKGNEVGSITNSGELISTRQNTNTTTAGTAAKATVSGEASYLDAETIKEAIATKKKVMKTGFSLLPAKLTIQQKGRPSGDISDNVYVTATLKFKNTAAVPTAVNSMIVYSFENLYDANKKLTPADKLQFSARNVSYINSLTVTNDLSFTTAYEGSIRAVGNKKESGENILEYDDKVTNYAINVPVGNPLTIDKNLFCKTVYKYTAVAGGVTYDLIIEDPQNRELDVFSEDNPLLFRQWLIDNVREPLAVNLKSNKFKMYFIDVRGGHRIDIVKSIVQPADLALIKTITSIAEVAR